MNALNKLTITLVAGADIKEGQPLSLHEGGKVFPLPVTRPWDFNSRPLETVWVYRKGFITDSMITAWGDDKVVISTKHGDLLQSYDQLLKDWLRRDGTPCGITEDAQARQEARP